MGEEEDTGGRGRKKDESLVLDDGCLCQVSLMLCLRTGPEGSLHEIAEKLGAFDDTYNNFLYGGDPGGWRGGVVSTLDLVGRMAKHREDMQSTYRAVQYLRT